MVESRCVLVPGHWAGVFGHQWSIPCLINLAGGSFLGFGFICGSGAYKAREPSIQVCELPALPPVAHPGPWVFHMRSPDHVNNGMQDLHEFPYFLANCVCRIYAGPRKKSGIEYFDSSAPMKATAAHVGEATAAPVGEASARYTGMVVWLKLPPATDGLDQPAPSDSSLPLRAAVEGQCAESVLTDKVVDSIATRSDPTDAAAKIVVDIVAAPLAPVVTTTDPPQKVAASL
ncbi:hypothetical protein V6N13_009980 [Hibiscus sabdariffa]